VRHETLTGDTTGLSKISQAQQSRQEKPAFSQKQQLMQNFYCTPLYIFKSKIMFLFTKYDTFLIMVETRLTITII
jgi:hypothetical protein